MSGLRKRVLHAMLLSHIYARYCTFYDATALSGSVKKAKDLPLGFRDFYMGKNGIRIIAKHLTGDQGVGVAAQTISSSIKRIGEDHYGWSNFSCISNLLTTGQGGLSASSFGPKVVAKDSQGTRLTARTHFVGVKFKEAAVVALGKDVCLSVPPTTYSFTSTKYP